MAAIFILKMWHTQARYYSETEAEDLLKAVFKKEAKAEKDGRTARGGISKDGVHGGDARNESKRETVVK